VDPSREVIARARRLTRVANCSFSEGTAEALDVPDGSYDVVVSSMMIHHLPETLRPQAIREMFRVLCPGGRVLVADFRPPTSRIGRYLIGPVISSAMLSNPVHLLDPMIREAGFEQVRSGDIPPWIRYVQPAKPTSAP
jgi:ubiquinone/menaquinone biosynthesis C-methylase UbiE